MSHVEKGVHARNLFHVCFVIHEIRICFDSCGYFFKFVSVFQLDIYHATVDSRTRRDSHRQSGFHSVNGFHGYCMSHTHSRTEVGISDPFRSNGFEHSAYDRVASRVPACGDDRYGFVFFSRSIQCAS